MLVARATMGLFWASDFFFLVIKTIFLGWLAFPSPFLSRIFRKEVT